MKVDGSCEIGPNAVPVFSPYGYNKSENIKELALPSATKDIVDTIEKLLKK